MKMVRNNLKAGHFSTFALNYILFLMVLANAQSKESSFNKEEDTNYFCIKYNDLKPGFKLPIYFGGAFPGKIPRFLPREKADIIPFSSQNLPFILEYFGFDRESQQAEAMESTLKICEMKRHGEQKRCITSLEAMLNYVRENFADDSFSDKDSAGFKVLSTSPLPKTSKLLQNYTILEVTRVPSPKMNACHMIMMVYPYAVFQCHYPEPENRVFQVLVVGEDGAFVDAIVNCHMNITSFDPNHVAFRMLGLTPGSPICHFLPSNDLVWVPAM